MKKLKISFWTWCINFGDFLGNLGDQILNKGTDKLNDIQKAEWLRSRNHKQD